MKKIVIIGAGPAGLTTGLDLLTKSRNYDVTIIEKSSEVGGLAKSIEHNGKVFDLGGHMFMSDDSQVQKFWESVLPPQGIPSRDDLILDRYCKISNGGPNPDDTDEVFLSRTNKNSIFTTKQFYDNPIMLTSDMVKTFGVTSSFKSELSKLGSNVFKRKEKTLEDYYVNRYGNRIYSLFLEKYLEKIWGVTPSKISASYGPVSDNDFIDPSVCNEKNPDNCGKSRNPNYYYPKLGVSQMWNMVADKFVSLGGTIHKNCVVQKIQTSDQKVTGITCVTDGQDFNVPCDILVSSMSLKDLVSQLQNVPFNVKDVVHGLSYRSMITIGVELEDMGYKNQDFDNPTINDFLPDSLLYIEEEKVKLGRIQIYNNFSPYISQDSEHVWLGLNYYCSEGDFYWNLGEKSWKDLVVNDLKRLNMIKSEKDILDYVKVSVSSALPVYNEFSDRIEEVQKYINTYDNLFCIGRNGQHKFLSMDQSMITGFETVKAIIKESSDKSKVWNASDRKNDKPEVKLYNSALLSEEGTYTGNYVPLQKEIPETGERREVSIRRMRRPMMTPIKKAEPVVEEKDKGPVFSKESVVIAQRPDQTIPFDDEEIASYNNQNEISANEAEYVTQTQEDSVVINVDSIDEQSSYLNNASNEESLAADTAYNDNTDSKDNVLPDSSYDEYKAAFEEEKAAIQSKANSYVKDGDDVNSSASFRSAASFRQVDEVSDLIKKISRPQKTENSDSEPLRSAVSFREVEEVSDALKKISRPEKSEDSNSEPLRTTTYFRNAEDVPTVSPSEGLFIGMPKDNPEPLAKFEGGFGSDADLKEHKDLINTTNRVSKEFNFIVTDDINVVVEPVRPEVGGIVKSDSIFSTGDIFKTDNIKRDDNSVSLNQSQNSGSIVKTDNSPIVGAFNDKQLNGIDASEDKTEVSTSETGENENLKIVKMENEIPSFHIVKSEDVASSIHSVAPDNDSAEESKEEPTSVEEIRNVETVKVAKTQEQLDFEREIEEEIRNSRKNDMTLDRSIVRGRSTVQDFADKKVTDVIDREDSGVIKGASTYDNILAGKNTVITSEHRIEPKPLYQPKKVIDPSEVFKNAKVIKTTVVSSGASSYSAPLNVEIKKESSKVDEFASNGKVIAVIRNGETIPVEEPKPEVAEEKIEKKEILAESTPKKTKSSKKRKDEDGAELVEAAPISVVIEPESAAEEANALPVPKKRGRKPKINK